MTDAIPGISGFMINPAITDKIMIGYPITFTLKSCSEISIRQSMERDIPKRSTHSLFDPFNAAMHPRMHNAALIPYAMTFFIFSFLFQKT